MCLQVINLCVQFFCFSCLAIFTCVSVAKRWPSVQSHITPPFRSQPLAVTDTYMQNAVIQYHNWPNTAQPFHYSLIFSVHMHSDLHRDIHFSKHNVKTPEVSKLL